MLYTIWIQSTGPDYSARRYTVCVSLEDLVEFCCALNASGYVDRFWVVNGRKDVLGLNGFDKCYTDWCG